VKAAVAAEPRRVTSARAAQERDLFAAQEDHARSFRGWQGRQRAFREQALWYPVSVPAELDRVDVVGGTVAGWSALLTMVAMPRLAAGDEITIIDLSEGAVASDLARLAPGLRVAPLVWVLPDDLPRLDLGAGLPAAAMADILAACAPASLAGGGSHDPAPDHALLGRLLEVLGDGARICQVTAGLRALAQVGDLREDVRRGLLTDGQLERITRLFGRGAADRMVIEPAGALQARPRVRRVAGHPGRARAREAGGRVAGRGRGPRRRGVQQRGALRLRGGNAHPPAPPCPSRSAVAAHDLRGGGAAAPRRGDRPARRRVRGHPGRAGARLPLDSAARRTAARPRERGAGGDAPRERRGRQGGQGADRLGAPASAAPAPPPRGSPRH